MTSLYYFHSLSFLFVPSPMYSLRSELLVAEMDVSRCILVLDTSVFIHFSDKYLRTEGVCSTSDLVQTGMKGVKIVQTGHPTGLLVEKGNIGVTLYTVVLPGLDLLSTHRSRWLE